jgi:hypothetical protein
MPSRFRDTPGLCTRHQLGGRFHFILIAPAQIDLSDTGTMSGYSNCCPDFAGTKHG